MFGVRCLTSGETSVGVKLQFAAGDAPALHQTDGRETRSRLKARSAHRLKAYIPRNGSTIIASSGRRRLEGTLAISARASSLRPADARTEACTATAEAETALLGTFKLA